MRRILLSIFLFLVTIAIFVYVFFLTTTESAKLSEMYDENPSLQYIAVTLGLYDTDLQYEPDYQAKKSLKERMREILTWKRSGRDTESPYWLEIKDDISVKHLYSPIYVIEGKVSPGAQDISVIYTHPGREITRTLDVDRDLNDPDSWSIEVNLANETIFNGDNIYEIQVKYQDGELIRRKIKLVVDYQRIELGDSVLFLDPYYILSGSEEDILRESDDFDTINTNFLTISCDPTIDHDPVLVQYAYQYVTVPACLSFSLMKRYLLIFDFVKFDKGIYYYDILLPDGQELFKSYPLYLAEYGNIYMSLPFWDQQNHILKTLRMTGDKLKYIISIIRHNLENLQEELHVTNTNGTDLLVETPQEKLIVYMYKDRGDYRSLIYPGLRYMYYRKSLSDNWTKINEGSIAVSNTRVVKPRTDIGPTFDFNISLVEDQMRIDDGVHVVSFDINEIGLTIDSIDKEYLLDQPGLCDQWNIKFYRDYYGNEVERASPYDEIYMIGEGLLATNIHISHNGAVVGVEPDRSHNGYMLYTLSSKLDNLVPGSNIYTIVLSDRRGQELCRNNLSLYVE